ncbi:hypothetical protein ACL02S_14415 [Nocardia sp. 004]|uniref:hypothetical protein n=1 Tax=Nocardia sp. 004 TaxID=3385978 RepID=UPI0039A38221
MNYAEEARRLAEENHRRMAILLAEIEEINERTTAAGREFAENLAAEMNRFRMAQAAESAQDRTEEAGAARAEEAAERSPAAETREHREAIARSMAVRKAGRTVTPIDEEDEEAKFYQRESWLI